MVYYTVVEKTPFPVATRKIEMKNASYECLDMLKLELKKNDTLSKKEEVACDHEKLHTSIESSDT